MHNFCWYRIVCNLYLFEKNTKKKICNPLDTPANWFKFSLSLVTIWPNNTHKSSMVYTLNLWSTSFPPNRIDKLHNMWCAFCCISSLHLFRWYVGWSDYRWLTLIGCQLWLSQCWCCIWDTKLLGEHHCFNYFGCLACIRRCNILIIARGERI